MGPATRVGVDVGGTFTDLVAIDDGAIVTSKVSSSPADQSLGVLAALREARLRGDNVSSIAHGTTVATNALLERRGARTALVTTEGFRDVIEIGRQNRASLYDLTASGPTPLVDRELRFTVAERIGPSGVRLALSDESIQKAVEAVRDADVDAVAVCLLFSFANPTHERRIRTALEEALPDVFVTASSDVLPEFREYERFATTTAGAYVGPILASYLDRLRTRLEHEGLPQPLVMQSSGGVIDVEAALDGPSKCVLSGPAAGVVAAAYVGEQSGCTDLLTFDMGGTSTDVGLVLGGEVQVTTGSVVGGVPIRHPMVDVHTVSAGGGSVAWVDGGGALRVGPVSAGALPGPACYGRGGAEATVTDADLFLGYLDDGATLGGDVELSLAAAEAAVERLAGELGLEPVAAAVGVVTIAEAEMIRALRVISVERGIDPRALTLTAFGGAGGMHACRLAEELEMTRILFPRAAGVLSALGLAVSDLRRDYVAPFLRDLQGVSAEDLEGAYASLDERARADLDVQSLARFADVRYGGQSFELTIPVESAAAVDGTFQDAHERRYGYRLPDARVEVVALRLSARTPTPKPKLAAPVPGGHTSPRRRLAFFDGRWLDTQIVTSAELVVGQVIPGPAVVALPEATCVVRPGWIAATDDAGALAMERQ